MKLKISHLSIGLHEFDFEEKVDSFEIEGKERFPNPIRVHVKIDKEISNLIIKIHVCTLAHFTCDRCLDEFDREICEDTELLYSTEQPAVEYGEYSEYNDSEIRPYSKDMDMIDISKDVRDTLLLAVPMKVLCRPDCKGLCPVCGANLNYQTCHHEVEVVDPRWETLKGLLSGN